MTRSTRIPRLVPLAATGLTAIALTLSLAACSSGSDSADSASPAGDQAVTVESSADAAPDADATAVPEGFTLVEVPEYGVLVAVPSDWDTLTSANTSDEELVGRIAQALDDSEEEVIADLEDTPLTSVDTASDAEDPAYLYMTRSDGNGALPTEEMLRALAENHDATSSNYEQTTSGSGADAATFTMTGSEDGRQRRVSGVAVSDGDDAFFLVVVVSDSEQQLQEVSDAVIDSL
ncbi:hypothetical protein [Actinomyces ruminicola]|uniref:hypothetical protein n=1 Tax=Actinomyces ruminicola TaxID=332524 RepID=UPI0011CA94E8|nr:hypothetical protein [Actinomyces ruminicola]